MYIHSLYHVADISLILSCHRSKSDLLWPARHNIKVDLISTFLTGNIIVPHGSTFNSMEHNKEAPGLRRQLAEDTVKANSTLQETIAAEGYVADTLDERFVNVKTAKDGHTILIPQPSDDPNDPLNWSSARKHVILFIMSITAFLPDYGSATGAVTLIPQAQ